MTQEQKGGLCFRHGSQVLLCGEVVTAAEAEAEGAVCTNTTTATATARKYKTCSKEGCTKLAQNGGVCYSHGAKVKKCSSEGCMNNAKRRGLCKKHGAYSDP